ncbi:MAG: NTP transferase domain-containing protein [candidate division WS1 bacterium]|nr:NTP transferase domain-containing protein [candidate division WS1 bacterium]
MKGIILVGGLGTRLYPMTRVTNKHLLPVGRFPMVYYPLHNLVEAGIRDILIVTGGNSVGAFMELLRDGREFGLDQLYFAYQHAPQGIADALRCAESFVDGDSCVVMLGDNILAGSIKPCVDKFREQKRGARVLLKEVSDPQRFGVAEFGPDGRITQILEKPADPPSNAAVIGVYMYDAQVWELLPTLRLSARGQYEVTDLSNAYLERGELEHDLIPFGWSDAGTPESLHRASEMMYSSDFLPELEEDCW